MSAAYVTMVQEGKESEQNTFRKGISTSGDFSHNKIKNKKFNLSLIFRGICRIECHFFTCCFVVDIES